VTLQPIGQIELKTDPVLLQPFTDNHVEPLRLACEADQDIWDIYPVSMLGEHFAPSLAGIRSANNRPLFAVIQSTTNQVVGMTSYINPNPEGVVEIGGTYISPAVRGSGFNRVMKKLMLDHAFACGYRKVEFRLDTRNARSMAAVLKLGAKREGTLRQNRVTWTGYVRDTAVFGLLEEEWLQNQQDNVAQKP